MDIPCSEIDSQNNNNNNSKSECSPDTMLRTSDSNEQINIATESSDVGSSDLDYDCSDSDQDEIKIKSESAKDVENKTLSHEELNSVIQGEVLISTNSKKCHSDEKVSQLKQLNSIKNASKQATNCSEQEEREEEEEEKAEENKVALIDDNAVEEEPIFDFLGKANEIVCYAYFFDET